MGAKTTRSLLVFFSNPYMFEDQVAPALLEIRSRHPILIHVLLPAQFCSERLERSLRLLVENGELAGFEKLPWGKLRQELGYWIEAYPRLKRLNFDSVLLGSESYLSDLLVFSIGPKLQKVIVYPGQWEDRFGSPGALRFFLLTQAMRRPLHTLAGYVRNLHYRKLMGRAFAVVTGTRLVLSPARRFIGEGGADSYVLSQHAFDSLAGYRIDKEKCWGARFSRDLDGPKNWTGSCLLLAPSDPGWLKRRRYLRVIGQELLVLVSAAGIHKIVLRPHPTSVRFARQLSRYLRQNLSVCLSQSTTTLPNDLQAHSLVVGSVSAALDYAGEIPGLRVVSLADSTNVIIGNRGRRHTAEGVVSWSRAGQGVNGLSEALSAAKARLNEKSHDSSRRLSEVLESIFSLSND